MIVTQNHPDRVRRISEHVLLATCCMALELGLRWLGDRARSADALQLCCWCGEELELHCPTCASFNEPEF